MRHFALAAASLLAIATIPSAAFADATLNISIVANVDVFCQVSQADTDRVDVKDGMAMLGLVREVCNTPSGYVVTTQLSNVASGVLDVADQSIPIDSSGMAVRYSDQPEVKTMAWRLAEAKLDQPEAPVFMRVTIAPR